MAEIIGTIVDVSQFPKAVPTRYGGEHVLTKELKTVDEYEPPEDTYMSVMVEGNRLVCGVQYSKFLNTFFLEDEDGALDFLRNVVGWL